LVDGAGAFLGRICLPAAEEFGQLLRDRIKYWRAVNASKIAAMAEARLRALNAGKSVQAHPRLVGAIIEQGSWTDDEEVQQMWAGLLASSCTQSGTDEENLLFINYLQQLNSTQAKVLNHACNAAPKKVQENGLIWADDLFCSAAKVRELTGVEDIQRLDRELDHLRVLGLIEGGIQLHASLTAEGAIELTPTPLALHMYVRCQGSRESPVAFFALSNPSPGQAL